MNCSDRTGKSPLSNPGGLPGVEELYRSHRQPGRVAAKQEAAGKEKGGNQSVGEHTREARITVLP